MEANNKFSPENLMSIFSNNIKLKDIVLGQSEEKIFENHRVENIRRIEDYLSLNGFLLEANNPNHGKSLWGSFHNSLSFDIDRNGELKLFDKDHEHHVLDKLIDTKDIDSTRSENEVIRTQSLTLTDSDVRMMLLDSEEYFRLLTNPTELDKFLEERQKEIEQLEKDFRTRMRSYIIGQITNMRGMLQVFAKGSNLQKGTQVYIDWLHSVLNNSYAE